MSPVTIPESIAGHALAAFSFLKLRIALYAFYILANDSKINCYDFSCRINRLRRKVIISLRKHFFFSPKRLPLFFRPLIQNKLEVLGKAGLSEDVLEADCTFFKVRVLMPFSENSFVNVSGMALSLCGDVCVALIRVVCLLFLRKSKRRE